MSMGHWCEGADDPGDGLRDAAWIRARPQRVTDRIDASIPRFLGIAKLVCYQEGFRLQLRFSESTKYILAIR